jgi:hypothetical protein
MFKEIIVFIASKHNKSALSDIKLQSLISNHVVRLVTTVL